MHVDEIKDAANKSAHNKQEEKQEEAWRTRTLATLDKKL